MTNTPNMAPEKTDNKPAPAATPQHHQGDQKPANDKSAGGQQK